MAGVKGAKQKRHLNKNELNFIVEKLLKIKCGNKIKFCLMENDLAEITSSLKISKESLQRRWKISQDFSNKIIFCHGWEDRFKNDY